MATTFLKRQKEMKRLEKRREKAERRAHRKLASQQRKELLAKSTIPADSEAPIASEAAPSVTAPQD